MTILQGFLNKLGLAAPHKVVYDEGFFKPEWFKNWEELKVVLGTLLLVPQRWKKILDFGCGPGIMIDYMQDRSGVIYTGFDSSGQARALYLEYFGQHPHMYVTEMPDCNFDVLVAFDVLEHMTNDEIKHLIKSTPHINEYFFNISREKGIPGHINIKTDKEWIDFFDTIELHLDKQLTQTLQESYKKMRPQAEDAWDKNMFVFSR